MFEFGRELRRIFRNPGRIESDPSLYELLNLQLLITQGRQSDIEGGRVSTQDRFVPYLEAAQIWREYGRRTGDPVALRRAASAAENAGKAAKTSQEAAMAVLEQAHTCLLSCDLFGAHDLLASAEDLLANGRIAIQDDEAMRAHFNLAEAKLAARLALKQGVGEDLDMALLAMSHIDRAVERADKSVQKNHTHADKIEAAQARFERADMLMRVGLDRSDSSLMSAVITDFQALLLRLDPAYEPVTYGRVELRLALAYIWKGQIEQSAASLNAGITMLSHEDETLNYEHSPLDWVAHKQALALGLQMLSELTSNDELHEKALQVYDLALKRPLQTGLVLNAQLKHNRASCMAGHAERQSDLKALDRVEALFKAELRTVKPSVAAVDWAILQTHLARVYLARGDLTGFLIEATEAAYALEAAMEIFSEYHLPDLARLATAQMARVRVES